MAYYLNDPLSFSVPGTEWYNVPAGDPPAKSGKGGEIWKLVATDWVMVGAWHRRRIEWTLGSASLMYNLQVITPDWGYKAWRTSLPLSDHGLYYKVGDITHSWPSAYAFIAECGLIPAAYPGGITVKLAMAPMYDVETVTQFNDDYGSGDWIEVGREHIEYYFGTQETNLNFTIEDSPPFDAVFANSCAIEPKSFTADYANSPVSFYFAFQQRQQLSGYTPSHPGYFELLLGERTLYRWSGVIQPGQQATLAFPLTPVGILGREPISGESFTLTWRLSTAEGTQTDARQTTFTVTGAPKPNPLVDGVLILDSQGQPVTENVGPDDPLTFNVTLVRQSEIIGSESAAACVVVICDPSASTSVIDEGIRFAAGQTTLAYPFTRTPRQLYGQDFVKGRIYPLYLTVFSGNSPYQAGNGTYLSPQITVDVPVDPINTGRIKVTSNVRGAHFILRHIDGTNVYSGTIPYPTIPGALPGQYCITWVSVPGYTSPGQTCQTLLTGKEIEFRGEYQSSGGPTQPGGNLPLGIIALAAAGTGAILLAFKGRR